MSAQPHVIHILPFRSVQSDGVGDYAALLADEMRSCFGIDSSFIVANPDSGTALVDDGFATVPLPSHDAGALVSTVQHVATGQPRAALIIHMAGYGYARSGAPFWLAQAMQQLRRLRPDLVIIGLFHELFATGPIYSRSYWTGLLQQQFCRRAMRWCDHLVTTNSRYADWMTRSAAGTPLLTLPVFSTIGSLSAQAATDSRPRSLAIFARSNAASTVYGERIGELGSIIQKTGAQQIIDIGQRGTAPPQTVDGVPVTCLGRLSAADVAAQLQNCSYGVLDYGHMPLAKSTIFAAYAANGVVPLCLMQDHGAQDGLVPGQHFVAVPVAPDPSDWTINDENTMRENILAWYRPHALDQQAARFAEMASARPETPLHQ